MCLERRFRGSHGSRLAIPSGLCARAFLVLSNVSFVLGLPWSSLKNLWPHEISSGGAACGRRVGPRLCPNAETSLHVCYTDTPKLSQGWWIRIGYPYTSDTPLILFQPHPKSRYVLTWYTYPIHLVSPISPYQLHYTPRAWPSNNHDNYFLLQNKQVFSGQLPLVMFCTLLQCSTLKLHFLLSFEVLIVWDGTGRTNEPQSKKILLRNNLLLLAKASSKGNVVCRYK
jgi:hypothetical protein